MTYKQRPVVLCILDGWGEREETENNAIALARTPFWDRARETCPRAVLDASSEEVGLPEGQMGNSEVGHMNIGAGRVVLQDLPRIDAAVADGRLAENTALRAFIDKLTTGSGTAHVMGLLSPGGVHAHQNHIAALAEILAGAGVPVAIHALLDGRDTPPRSARDYLASFAARIDGLPGVEIATVSGRYYAMDRDKRWDRVEKAYDILVDAAGARAATAADAIAESYAQNIGDEFVVPAAIGGYAGMADGDGVLMANFRADRAREILAALLDPDFDGFARKRTVAFAAALGMVEYSAALSPFIMAMFPPDMPADTLGEVVSAAGLKQFRTAETEKYAHVTFFLNGGREEPFPGEDRHLVPSPKVATYDLKPEMSAAEVTDRLVAAIDSGDYDFAVVNYANTDMVGHTGILDAAIAAVETVDGCLARLGDAVERQGGCLLITADHGNAELMADPATDEPHTAHSRNKVPCLLVNGPAAVGSLADGRLADVAPTVLELMGLTPPAAMTGRSLLRPVPSRMAASAAE